eukprot:s2448_g7.t1
MRRRPNSLEVRCKARSSAPAHTTPEAICLAVPVLTRTLPSAQPAVRAKAENCHPSFPQEKLRADPTHCLVFLTFRHENGGSMSGVSLRPSLQRPLLSASEMRWLRATHCLGLLLIVLVALIWVAASQLIETIFKDQSFDHPYFLTYFNTCGFTFWLLATACAKASPGVDVSPEGDQLMSEQEPGRCGRLRKYGAMALVVSPAWLAANYLFNLSLDYTSVASNSMFSTTSNLWTMLFSVCFLGERLNPFHVLAVIFTMAGSSLVAMADAADADDGEQKSSWVGDCLALVSACVYGAYTVLLKHCVPENEERLAMPTLFGCIGLLVLVFGWPLLLLFDHIAWEDFAWPSRSVLGTLSINALIGTNLSDVLWAYAVQLTTPLTEPRKREGDVAHWRNLGTSQHLVNHPT